MATCASCNDPLVHEIHDYDDSSDEDLPMGDSSASASAGASANANAAEPHTVPDDVELKACGHHFHWYE